MIIILKMTRVRDISGLILRVVLSIYMEDPSLPLPTPEEVLVCNPSTTAEEVTSITHIIIARYKKWGIFPLSLLLNQERNHVLLFMRPDKCFKKERFTDVVFFNSNIMFLDLR